MEPEYIAWFDALGSGDVARVGGKNASLGEMVRALESEGVRVPDGFATTAAAYREFITANGIETEMRERVEALQSGKASLHETGEAIRRLFLDGEFPESIADAIRATCRELSQRSQQREVSVAVRSNATAEDLPQANFAGQQETFLNVRGERALLDACRRCYASLFTDRAISYRETQGFDHLEVALSIGVQRMVRSDLAGSGVMFSIDTETGFAGVAVISAAWGLGETVVQGSVDPDKYLVLKSLPDDKRYFPIIERTLGAKESKMIYAPRGSTRTATVATSQRERQSFVLADAEIGSNDLTQRVLGVDRDSGELAPLFDERNEAVKRAIREAITKAHAAGIKIGICGQASSNYPEVAAFLVAEGIDPISLNPDSFVATVRRVADEEHRLDAASSRTRKREGGSR